MDFYKMSVAETADKLGTDTAAGLTPAAAENAAKKFGKNVLSARKPKSLIRRIFDELTEPMMLILLFALGLTLTVNITSAARGAPFDLTEILGIAGAIALSVAISLVMEGRSAKAYAALKKIGGGSKIFAVRGGRTLALDAADVVVGDVVLLSAGDKVPADCRLVEAEGLYIDESMLTGESAPAGKQTEAIGAAPLAERTDMAYSGCFVTEGRGRAIVTAVGDGSELGKIAGSLKPAEEETPIQLKLKKLSKRIAAFGIGAALLTFVVSLVKLILAGHLTFAGVSDLFVTAIVLIVACVPEGLPTIVAIALALNVVKMAGANALVKKMVACETVGCISVICSDKTGTLTENRMTVQSITDARGDGRENPWIVRNAAINSTAELDEDGGFLGSPTECALLSALPAGIDYRAMRAAAHKAFVFPFSSELKRMTTIADGVVFVKGAPETVIALCGIGGRGRAVLRRIEALQARAMRVIAFAHKPYTGGGRAEAESGLVFDGYAAISDPVRPEVYAAVRTAASAGIGVKILTGDNAATAAAVARELGLIRGNAGVFSADEIESMTDPELEARLKEIRVVARSTPSVKMRVVRALKKAGEVVAVTGDGVNDAPAITAADVGIAMGSGTEVSKAAADIVLLDDSFGTIVGAVQWGRGIYENFQRFILFQLSVNVAAVAVVIFSILFDYPPPFNTLQLLWINLIMDGPPALSLGLEPIRATIMRAKPVRRNASIVTKRMFLRIFSGGLYMAGILVLQMLTNFARVAPEEEKTFLFTCFVLFQLFNAFNARETGTDSIAKSFFRNRLMLAVLGVTLALQVLITQFGARVFDTVPLSAAAWGKALLVSLTVVLWTELYKILFKAAQARRKSAHTFSAQRVK